MMSYATPTKHDLERIARQTMIQRGLLPDFSPVVMAETRALGDRLRVELVQTDVERGFVDFARAAAS